MFQLIASTDTVRYYHSSVYAKTRNSCKNRGVLASNVMRTARSWCIATGIASTRFSVRHSNRNLRYSVNHRRLVFIYSKRNNIILASVRFWSSNGAKAIISGKQEKFILFTHLHDDNLSTKTRYKLIYLVSKSFARINVSLIFHTFNVFQNGLVQLNAYRWARYVSVAPFQFTELHYFFIFPIPHLHGFVAETYFWLLLLPCHWYRLNCENT